jgi:hypothetical protein
MIRMFALLIDSSITPDPMTIEPRCFRQAGDFPWRRFAALAS